MLELPPSVIEFTRSLPPWAAGLALIGVVVVSVLLVYGIFAALGYFTQEDTSDQEPTLADRAEPILRARSGIGKFDASFDRLIEGTQFGIAPETGIGLILLVSALAGSVVGLLTFDPLLTLGAGLGGGILAYSAFALFRNRRKRKVQELLPDGCFQLARSLRSGLHLRDALRETARYVPAPLSGLLERVAAALTLGEPTRLAVRHVADDVAVTEFDLLTEVLATHAESGGNLPALLDRLAGAMRDRNQFRGYFRSVTALSRVTAMFLAMAGPFGVFIYAWVQPELFRTFVTTQLGQMIIMAAATLEVIGLTWLFFLLRRRDDY